MIERHKVCQHCGSNYRYFLSGVCFTDPRLNDERYCPDCMAEMVKMLDSVPVKFKEVWVDASDEITLEELYEAEKTDKRLTRRVFPGLMASGDSYCTREIVANGVYYYLTEWTHFHEYEIQRRVRWNLIDDIAEKLTDNKSRKKKILYNPNKSSEKPKPMKIEPIAVMSPPQSLAYALRFAEERIDLWNQEIDIAMKNEVRDV